MAQNIGLTAEIFCAGRFRRDRGLFLLREDDSGKSLLGENWVEKSGSVKMGELKKRDAVSAICWITLGSVILIWSASFPFGKRDAPGPAIFPLLVGLILICLGMVLFVQARKRDEVKGEENLVPLIPRGTAFRRVAFSLGGMLLSAVLLDHLGFLLTFFCLILFLVRAVQPQEWGKDTFYAVIFTLAAYMLFQVLLKTTLPKGFLGF